MKQLSTTALAKQRGLEPNDLFKVLTEKNWMYKRDGKWHLTKEGRMAGGDMKYNPKYGEFIVWPSDLDTSQEMDYSETISATQIGTEFELSGQKINLHLSELGWVEKNYGGWVATNIGEKNGAIQMEAQNGKPYVVWKKTILENNRLINSIKEATGDTEYLENEKNEFVSDDFRKKYPAEYRTPDGHYVRSRAELLIDDFLYKNGIVHAYERKLNIDEDMYCDFYIPNGNIYIEYWGLEDKEYQERKRKKLEIYSRYNFKLIELDDTDLNNLDENLASKLRKHNIIVH